MQTIWITGGSSGIGFAVAQKFLEENWRVIISSRNEEKLKKAVEKLKKQTSKKEIFYKACDVSKYNDVKDTLAYIETDISKIDIARNNIDITILEIENLDELKQKIIKVIIMVLIVNFFERILKMPYETPEDLLWFAISVLALSIGIYLVRKDDPHSSSHK